MPKKILFLIPLCFLLATCSVINPSRGDISRVFLVDSNGSNLLFRGSDPVIVLKTSTGEIVGAAFPRVIKASLA